MACHELWGARNEYVHNGRLLVRHFDATQNRVVKTNTRPLVDHNVFEAVGAVVRPKHDYARFRRAVISAIDWMRAHGREPGPAE